MSDRYKELAERLVSAGRPHDKFSCSEFHELYDYITNSQKINTGDIKKEITKFSKIMQGKIDKNKHKECSTMNKDGKGRTWKQANPRWLLYRLRQEVLELDLSMNDGSSNDSISKECADVANFSMMIADVYGALT